MRLILTPDQMNTPLEENHFFAAAATLISKGWSAVYPEGMIFKTIVLHDERIESLKEEIEQEKKSK